MQSASLPTPTTNFLIANKNRCGDDSDYDDGRGEGMEESREEKGGREQRATINVCSPFSKVKSHFQREKFINERKKLFVVVCGHSSLFIILRDFGKSQNSCRFVIICVYRNCGNFCAKFKQRLV